MSLGLECHFVPRSGPGVLHVIWLQLGPHEPYELHVQESLSAIKTTCSYTLMLPHFHLATACCNVQLSVVFCINTND